jgi:Fe-S cluster biogenesis protein NfuA
LHTWEDRQDMEAQLLEAIDAIRPALQADGGDLRLVNYDQEKGVVDIELMGACGGCPMSTMTLKAGIERILMDRVDGLTEVRALGLDDADPFAHEEY